MAIVLKATYSTGLTQAGLSDHRFSLSVRAKVAPITGVPGFFESSYAFRLNIPPPRLHFSLSTFEL